MNDLEKASTETLLITQENLLNGLATIAKHLEADTFHVSGKAGSASPAEFGFLPLGLLLGVEDELEARIKGFKRSIDPNVLVKTL